MTIHGVLVITLIALGYILWIVSLVRRGHLYAGYAVVWVVLAIGISLIVAIPQLLALITVILGALFPVNALTFLAIVFLFGIQIYILSQMTIMSRRIMLIAQAIAIKEGEAPALEPTKRDLVEDNK